METIMEYLQPTDVSAFIYATAFYNKMRRSDMARYMNIGRQARMSVPWVGDVLDAKNPVLLIGEDLYRTTAMFTVPATYWRKKGMNFVPSFKFWLLPLSKVSLHIHETGQPNPELTWMYKDGTIETLSNLQFHNLVGGHLHNWDCKGSICQGRLPGGRVMLPIMDRWPSCAKPFCEGHTAGDWVTLNERTTDSVKFEYKFDYTHSPHEIRIYKDNDLAKFMATIDKITHTPYINLLSNEMLIGEIYPPCYAETPSLFSDKYIDAWLNSILVSITEKPSTCYIPRINPLMYHRFRYK